MADTSGRPVWVAEIPDLPSCRATGSSRIEALDRVRQVAERRSNGGGFRHAAAGTRQGVAAR